MHNIGGTNAPEPFRREIRVTTNEEARRFSYRRTAVHTLMALLVAGFGVACVLLPLHPKPGWKPMEIFFGLGLLFFLVILIDLLLVDSDIEVSSHGISMYVLGRRWRDINWSNVKHARIFFPTFSTGFGTKTIKLYRLYETDRPRLFITRMGGAIFSSRIAEFGVLEGIVKAHIDKWNIPLTIDSRHSSRYKG